MTKEPQPQRRVPTALRLAFGARVRKARKRIGMSAPQLAAEVGVSPAAVGQWEQGLVGPSFETLQELPDALGVSVEWLVHGTEDDINAQTLDERRVMRTMRCMTLDQQSMLAGIVGNFRNGKRERN